MKFTEEQVKKIISEETQSVIKEVNLEREEIPKDLSPKELEKAPLDVRQVGRELLDIDTPEELGYVFDMVFSAGGNLPEDMRVQALAAAMGNNKNLAKIVMKAARSHDEEKTLDKEPPAAPPEDIAQVPKEAPEVQTPETTKPERTP